MDSRSGEGDSKSGPLTVGIHTGIQFTCALRRYQKRRTTAGNVCSLFPRNLVQSAILITGDVQVAYFILAHAADRDPRIHR